jgi:hypothetical protein
MNWTVNETSVNLKKYLDDMIQQCGWPKEEITINILMQGALIAFPATAKMDAYYASDFRAITDTEFISVDRNKIPDIVSIDLVRKKTEKPFNPNDRIGG